MRHILRVGAFALMASVCLFSCKKKPSDLGLGLQNPDILLDLVVEDTFHIITYSQVNDTARGDYDARLHIGSYVDPELGKTDFGSFFQLELGGSPDFSGAGVIDSVVLVLDYIGAYGVEDVQTFSVHEVTEDLSVDAEYQVDYAIQFDPTELIKPTRASLQVNASSDLVLGNGDTVAAQMRLALDTALGRRIIDAEAMGTWTDNDSWQDYFKGIYVQSDNPAQTSGDGAALTMDGDNSQSGLWIYFRETDTSAASTQQFYQFDVGEARSTLVSFDRTGFPAGNQLNDSTLGQQAFYLQPGGLIARMEFPTLDAITDSNNIIVNSAELVVPIQYFAGGPYLLPPFLFMDYLTSDGDRLPVRDFDLRVNQGNTLFEYDGILKSDNGFYYSIRLNVQMQEALTGEIDAQSYVLYADGFDVTVGVGSGVARIVANGQQGGFKEKPYLRLKYTKY